jgi:serine/threonine protein kinase
MGSPSKLGRNELEEEESKGQGSSH